MVVSININDNLANQLYVLFNSEDMNKIVNTVLTDAVKRKSENIQDFFGNVNYSEDYDYKISRQRNECLS